MNYSMRRHEQGRAGYYANGVVLLVPDALLSFQEKNTHPSTKVLSNLEAIMPKEERCVEINDPLQGILDRISEGKELDNDSNYIINRCSTLPLAESSEASLFNLKRSFAAHRLRKKEEEDKLNQQFESLEELVDQRLQVGFDESILKLAMQSGLPPLVLLRLQQKINDGVGQLPNSIVDWVSWMFEWLALDQEATDLLLFEVKPSILKATGNSKEADITEDIFNNLHKGVVAWISGEPLCKVETELGGDPDANPDEISCPRSRELIGSVLPRGLSFIMGLISRLVEETDPYKVQENLTREVVSSLPTAIRLGYDSPEKLNFSLSNPQIISRVAVHQKYSEQESPTE